MTRSLRWARALVVGLVAGAACSQADAQTLQACRARVSTMRAAFAAPEPGHDAARALPAWAQTLYEQLRQTHEPRARAALLDEGVGKTIDGCYGLADAFREAAAAPAGSRRAAMTKLVPPAIESCECRGVDVESLTLFLRLSPST